MSVISKDGIVNVFDGYLDWETVEKLAKKYNFYIDDFEKTSEDGSPKTLIRGREMDERFIKTISYHMPPELNSLLIEMVDFENFGPHIKDYFESQGFTPGSRHRPNEKEKWEVYKRHREAVAENCKWDRFFFGLEQENIAEKYLSTALGLDWR